MGLAEPKRPAGRPGVGASGLPLTHALPTGRTQPGANCLWTPLGVHQSWAKSGAGAGHMGAARAQGMRQSQRF